MKSTFIAAIFALVATVAAVPPFDPAGAPHVGNGKGEQFITGQCLSDADCASKCCAKPTGICSGPGAATQQGKEGCGFTANGGGGGGSPPPPPPPPPPPAASGDGAFKGGPPFDPAGAPHVGNGKGEQFITGQCLTNADCASGCCAGPSGICSGPGAATQAGKTGCGFPGLPPPADNNNNNNNNNNAPPKKGLPPFQGGPPFDPAGEKNVGNGKGGQFITGQCLNNADCASGCCAGPSGSCSGPGAATQAGKTGCGFIAKRELALPGGRSAILD